MNSLSGSYLDQLKVRETYLAKSFVWIIPVCIKVYCSHPTYFVHKWQAKIFAFILVFFLLFLFLWVVSSFFICVYCCCFCQVKFQSKRKNEIIKKKNMKGKTRKKKKKGEKEVAREGGKREMHIYHLYSASVSSLLS